MTANHFVSFESARILVVDDDPILREFAIAHLTTPNVDIEVAEHGEAAWQMLSRQTFDIMLLDLDMPVMDGFELLGLIRSDRTTRDLPVVVATGREDMVAVDKAFAAGATSFVIKPLNWRLISHQLSYVLREARTDEAVRATLKRLQDGNALKSEILTHAEARLGEPIQSILKLSQDLADAGNETGREIHRLAQKIERLHQDVQKAAKIAG